MVKLVVSNIFIFMSNNWFNFTSVMHDITHYIYVSFSISRIEDIEGSVTGLALTSWPDRSVVAACISLLLMTGLDPSFLQSVIAAADLVSFKFLTANFI